jgi:acyl carrier protein
VSTPQDAILDIVAEQTNISRDRLALDVPLDQLGIDSLTAMETIFEVEDRFGINIPVSDPRFAQTTLGSLVETAMKLIDEKAARETAPPAGAGQVA